MLKRRSPSRYVRLILATVGLIGLQIGLVTTGFAQDTQSQPAEQKPLSLENISKKMSLWPKEVTVTKAINYRTEAGMKTIAVGQVLPVVSIRPEGIEIENDGARMIVPQEVVDLRTPIMERIQEIAAQAEKERQNFLAQHQAQQGEAPGAQAPPQQMQQGQPGQGQGQRPERPKPRIQTTEPTEFIRALDQDLIIAGNNRLLKYSSLSFRNNHYYLIFMGASWDEGTQKMVAPLMEFYEGARKYNSNFEIVYVSFDRNEVDARKFLLNSKMPWPAIEPKMARRHRELVPLEAAGIPAFALVDRQGNVISHSHGDDRKSYRGSGEVLGDLASVLDLPARPAPGM